MASKKTVSTPEVLPVTAVAIAKPTGNVLAIQGARPELQARIDEVKDNLESIENFRLPRVKMNSAGFELIEGEPVITELEGVIVHARKANVYYKDAYNPREMKAPDCFSQDGNYPDESIVKPVSKECKGCPMAEYGTNSMKSGKACRNLKPLYLLLSDEAIMPRQLTITPTSLKAANQYLMDLTERGYSYRKVKTKITAFKKDVKDTYVTLKFERGARLDEQQIADVAAIRAACQPVMDAQVIDQNEVDNGNVQPLQPTTLETKEY